jgi:hypothetical protein
MLSACSALRAMKNPSRRKRLCGIFSPPQFGQGTFASQSPIVCPNRHIPRTLDDINTEKYKKKYIKIIQNRNNLSGFLFELLKIKNHSKAIVKN